MLRNWASTTYFCQAVEAVLASAVLIIALVWPHLFSPWFNRLEQRLASFAQRPWRAALMLFSGLIMVRLLLLPLLPVPLPSIHDEFSYSLAGETFADGRLANTPHSFWQHFESVHILQQPTYVSIYPPAQGLFLAAGLRITGLAWAGVLLSIAFLFPALFWALRGWCPPAGSLVMTVIAAVRWGIASYWGNSYWGGAVPALGGSLVFGSIPRLARTTRIRDAVAFGFGCALLANSRPYEGLVFSLACVAVLFLWTKRNREWKRLLAPAILVPIASILIPTFAGMLFYNARTTGHAVVPPYVQDRRQYASAPLFIWANLRPEPKFHSASLRRVYGGEIERYRASRAAFGIPEIFRKLRYIWIFFFGPLLTIPLIALILSTRAGENACRIALVLLVMLAAWLQVVWFYPHYAAPAFPALMTVPLIGFQRLRSWRYRGRPTGLFLSRAIPIACVLMASLPAGAPHFGWRLSYWPLQWALGVPSQVHPPELNAYLLAHAPKALVFIEYGPHHDPGYEWVYNSPNVDSQPVVWARRVNPESDAALMHYFADRTVWLLNPDEHPLKPACVRCLYQNPDPQDGNFPHFPNTTPDRRAIPTRP